MQLQKRDKKIAREIIEKGLQKEFTNGLNAFDETLQQWKNHQLNNRDAYHALYGKVVDFDKHIARRYDNVTGSQYVMTVAAQFIDGVIDKEDLDPFSEEVQQYIQRMADWAHEE